MDSNIDYETLQQMPKLNGNRFFGNGDIYIENDKFLLKALKNDLHTMVKYLKNIPDHEHVIKPLAEGKVTYPDSLESKYNTIYRMRYLENAKTLLTLYKEDVSYEKLVEYGKQLFSALHFLHKYIVLGDIHPQNILISGNNAYLGNLDNAKKPQWLIYPINCLYYINALEQYGSSKYTDTIKLYFECLSIIIGIPLSSYIIQYGYAGFYDFFSSFSLPDEIRSFLKLNQRTFHKLGE